VGIRVESIGAKVEWDGLVEVYNTRAIGRGVGCLIGGLTTAVGKIFP